MSTTDTQVQNLIVNKLSYDQWTTTKDAGDLSPTEAYEITDLDNTFDTVANKLSNCILEIPQNLKMEISGSNVIVKAGSIGVRPGSTYQTYTFTSDYSFDYSTTPDGTYYFMVGVYSGGPRNIGLGKNVTVSGSTDSLAGTGYHTWFDTTNLQIKRYSSDPNNPDVASMYPFAIINVENGVPSFAKDSKGNDMIFNGACFVGHHAVVYPNEKALLPNEFNDDGSLKSREVISDSLTIFEMIEGDALGLPRVAHLDENRVVRSSNYREMDSIQDIIDSPAKYYDTYIPSLNGVYLKENNDKITKRIRTYILKYSYNGTTVTDFTIRQPVRLATTEMLNDVNADLALKANDADVVHKTGNETITGTKTFTNGLERSAALSSNRSIVTELIDTNGKGSVQNQSFYTDNTIYNRLQAYNTTSGKYCYIDIRSADSGNGNVAIQSTGTTENISHVDSSTTLNMIATMGWVNNPATSTNVVHRTGNETIAGEKTFTGEILRQMSSLDYGGIKVKNTAITKGTTPSSNTGGQFTFQDSTTGNSASSRIGGIESVYGKNGNTWTKLEAYKPEVNSTEYASIEVGYKADGTKYATAPTPAASDDSNKIATTEWVNDNAVTQSDLSTVHVVVETYKNGASWYRVYDDGWVEQGGVILEHNSQTVNLLKQYVDANYCVYLSEASATTSALDVSRNSQIIRGTLTASSFTCYINNNNNVIAFWYACGMGA